MHLHSLTAANFAFFSRAFYGWCFMIPSLKFLYFLYHFAFLCWYRLLKTNIKNDSIKDILLICTTRHHVKQQRRNWNVVVVGSPFTVQERKEIECVCQHVHMQPHEVQRTHRVCVWVCLCVNYSASVWMAASKYRTSQLTQPPNTAVNEHAMHTNLPHIL